MQTQIGYQKVVATLVILIGSIYSEAATVSLFDTEQLILAGAASASGVGDIGGGASFSSRISSANAGADDFAMIEVQGDTLRTWINDGSDNQANWETDFSFSFEEPIDNLMLVPESPANNSDTVLWTVSWEASSDVAAFQNSPDLIDEYSLYLAADRLPSGEFASGTTFRMDDDALLSGDANGTTGGDLNISVPSSPWVIELPDGVTSIDVQASVPIPTADNRAFEGIGIDFSAVTVPEPGSCGILLIGLAVVVSRHRRT